MRHKNPPKWCPNAIATSRGWVHPKTGELLVSIKGLDKPNQTIIPNRKITQHIVLEITEKPTVIDTVSVELETKDTPILNLDSISESEICQDKISESKMSVELVTETPQKESIQIKKKAGRPKKQ